MTIRKMKNAAKKLIAAEGRKDILAALSDFAEVAGPVETLALIERLEEVTEARDALAAKMAAVEKQQPVVTLYVENGRIEDIPWQDGLMAYPDGNVMLYARPVSAAPTALDERSEFEKWVMERANERGYTQEQKKQCLEKLSDGKNYKWVDGPWRAWKRRALLQSATNPENKA